MTPISWARVFGVALSFLVLILAMKNLITTGTMMWFEPLTIALMFGVWGHIIGRFGWRL